MKKSTTAILGFLAAIVFSLICFQAARAAFPGEGLTISPPINELKIKPGETTENVIRVTNPTSELVEVYPQVMDFRAGGEGGEPSFYISEGDSDKFSLAKWITFSSSKLALTPEQIVEFRYTLTIPEDAEPGGHYGAVFFVSEPPVDTEPESKVSIGSMVGSLILLTVPGETIEKGVVDDFSTNKNIFIVGDKATFTTRISNIGNVHFKPKGNIVVKSVFGKEQGVISFNEQAGNVLPDSIRKFENEWRYPWYKVGIYRAELATIYGVSEKPLASVATFWILPWWLIAILIAIVISVISFFWYRKRRNSPKKNISKAQPIILR